MRAARWGRYGSYLTPSERFAWIVEFVCQTKAPRYDGSTDFYDDHPFHRSDLPYTRDIRAWLDCNIPDGTYLIVTDAVLFEQEGDALMCYAAFAK